jgi:hypothetical protein
MLPTSAAAQGTGPFAAKPDDCRVAFTGNTPGMLRRITIAGTALGLVALAVGALAGNRTPVGASTAPTASSPRWAVVVGITDYQGRTASTAAGAADAADVHDLLVRNGFPEDHVLTLTEGQATAAGIRRALQWLADRSTPDSFSVFHYSGHVKQRGGDRDHDGEAVDEYLWPVDNALISDGELSAAMGRVRGLAWVDIAGCEAAGFDDGLSGPTRLFTASSKETEKSYEDPEWGNSVFTGLEVDQGMLQGRADRDGNGRVSIQEAFAAAAERAPQVTKGQSRGPQHPVSAGGDGSEWFLQGPPPPPPTSSCGTIVCRR